MDLRVVKTIRTEDGPSGAAPENPDALGQEVPKTEKEKKSTSLLLPSWLVQNCVQRPDSKRDRQKSLLVRETDSASDLLPVDNKDMPLAVDFEIGLVNGTDRFWAEKVEDFGFMGVAFVVVEEGGCRCIIICSKLTR